MFSCGTDPDPIAESDPVVQPITVLACDKDEISSPQLISIQAAKSKIEEPNTIVVEISPKQSYDAGHLPKAIQVWRPDFGSQANQSIAGMRCSAEELTLFLQNLGLTEDSHLLLYDHKGGCDAMRLAWVFDYYGFQKYQVINGGKQAWKDQGFPLDDKVYTPIPNRNFVHQSVINDSILATKEEVLAAVLDTQTIIIDTREEYEYKGQCFISKGNLHKFKKGAFARGAIPSAVHLNWSILSDLANDHRVKCKKDLVYDLAQRGITKDKKIIVYCQSGSRSAHTTFVLRKILGYTDVKNYDGSWIEWSQLAQTQHEYPILQLTSEEEFEDRYADLVSAFFIGGTVRRNK